MEYIAERASRSTIPISSAWVRWLGCVAASLLLASPAGGFVVINEVHYHPPSPGGKTLEFVELFNPLPTTLDLSGWRLSGGVAFEFPRHAAIPATGYLIVARRRDDLVDHFQLDGALVLGNYDGALDNGGDRVVLLNERNGAADLVVFDDRFPWPEEADGGGRSLQRHCSRTTGRSPDNWAAAAPTPLGGADVVVCPPPSRPRPQAVISEIHYHPAGDREEEEFVELHNPGDETLSVGGWRFVDGIQFTLPPSTSIAPRGYLAICRDADLVSRRFGTANAIGNFSGKLSNRGERIAVADAQGALVDAVVYSDTGDWSAAADGSGRSLEKYVAADASHDPASWTRSVLPSGRFGRLSYDCPRMPLRLVFGVLGAGEFIVDNVVVENLDEPGVNIVPNGDFEDGRNHWGLEGVMRDSRVEEGIGVDGSAGLRLTTETGCGEGCVWTDAVASWFVLEGERDAPHRVSFDYRHVSGDPRLFLDAFSSGLFHVVLTEALQTPGSANSVSTLAKPPVVTHIGRHPEEPTSADPVLITARFASPESVAHARVEYVDESFSGGASLFDDGRHGDGFAGDGLYGGHLPAFGHNSIVRYRVFARDASGIEGSSPVPVLPGAFEPDETWGYYVNDNQVDSELPVYHLLLPGIDVRDPEAINDALFCVIRRPGGSFAVRGEVYPSVKLLFRGSTSCHVKKRNLKVFFPRDRRFRGRRQLNLQGMWTDKALVREHLAWDLFDDLGMPAMQTEYIRVHFNGVFHGLFLALEQPGRAFLERHGLNDDGCLYKKAIGEKEFTPALTEEKPGDYAEHWDEHTCEDHDFSDLAAFISSLHADARAAGGPSVEFLSTRVDPDSVLGFQVGNVLLNNYDHTTKNYFLLRDPALERWSLLPWDLDLSFGKYFNRDAIDPDAGRQVGTLNDCMLSPGLDMPPWFGTTILGEPEDLRNYLTEFFFHAGGGHFRRAYLIRLWDAVQEKLKNDAYDERLDALVALLATEEQQDLARWGRYPGQPGCETPDDMASNVETVKQQIGLHRDFLIDYLGTHHPEVVGHGRLKITEIMYNPEGAAEDLEFVELWNTTGTALDASLWRLSGGIEYEFPAGTEIADGEVVLVVKSRAAFLRRYPEPAARVFGEYTGSLANEGEEILVHDAGPGAPATIDRVRYGDGDPWPDVLDGFSIELSRAHPDRDNDRPGNWSASAAPGGSPGVISDTLFTFVRGEVNGDGHVDLADAMAILAYLFRGGPAPACRDIADVDDDGQLGLADAVFLLRSLFTRELRVRSPWPLAGIDPTPDELPCP